MKRCHDYRIKCREAFPGALGNIFIVLRNCCLTDKREVGILKAYPCSHVEVKCYLKIVLIKGGEGEISNCSEVFLEFALSVSNI